MIFRPTAKLVNHLFAGTLIGEVSEELATAVDGESGAAGAPAVFLFNDGVVPNPNALPEEPEDPNDSVASAMVQAADNGDGTTSYP